MVAPLNFAKLDNLAASNSAAKTRESWLASLHRSNHCLTEMFPVALYLSEEYRPSLRVTSSTGKRETHHELLTMLRVIPTCRQLLPYVPKLCMAYKTWC